VNKQMIALALFLSCFQQTCKAWI